MDHPSKIPGLPRLILASGSPRRAQLLEEAKIEFTVLTQPVQESTSEHLSPRELCLLNAYHKAKAVAKSNPDHLVLAADTVVSLGNEVYGKPISLEDAHRMLSELQGHTHLVSTGVCLLQWRAHRERLWAETTHVTFHQLSELEIRNYLNLIDPLDKAGGYAIQEHADTIVKQVQGSVSNVIGLPMESLVKEMQSYPWD